MNEKVGEKLRKKGFCFESPILPFYWNFAGSLQTNYFVRWKMFQRDDASTMTISLQIV